MRNTRYTKRGFVLTIVIISMIILTLLGTGLMTVAWGVRRRAIMVKNEVAAMLAAEAGYEKAIYWMSRQQDMLSAVLDSAPGTSGAISFSDSRCDYSISFFTFVGSRPIYRVVSNGHSGAFNRTVNVKVLQAISGWAMGMCRVPSGSTSTYPVNYASEEIIDMSIHINNLNDSPDERDIYISGDPQFLQSVAMGESKHTSGDFDKYSGVMQFFDGGIYFDQPESKITDEASLQSKVNRFEENTQAGFKFEPVAGASVSRPNATVHLEFFIEGGEGKVRITDDCTVRGYQTNSDYKTWDFKVEPDSGGTRYERYHIYAYHLRPEDADSTGKRFICRVDDSYVTQSIDGVESEPGGQIFVDGNVIIGSGDPNLPGTADAIKGTMTVVATGNIWIANSVVVDGAHDSDGKPSLGNPNVLGLIAQGVIKIVDPGMSDYGYVDDTPVEPEGFVYVPVGQRDSDQPPGSHKRHLPDPMVVEAAVTVGGGGWGAENVRRSSYGGRKEASGSQDLLVLRGTIAETIRGVVGLVGNDGYIKRYYLDNRLLEGILPGDIWLQGKYIPTPAGWHDYRPGS